MRASSRASVRDAYTENICRELAPSMDIRVTALVADACDALAPEAAVGLGEQQIVVIQNCLNEIAAELDVPQHDALLRTVLIPGGHIVISDLTEYQVIRDTVASYERLFLQAGLISVRRFDQNSPDVRSAFEWVPPRAWYAFFGAVRVGEQYEFPEGGRPKRWLRFSSSVWRKPPG
jgi:hypothetical protein